MAIASISTQRTSREGRVDLPADTLWRDDGAWVEPDALRDSRKREANRVTGMTPALYRQNMVTLAVLQALAHVLTQRVKGLTLEFVDDDVVAHFLLREESPEDEEEILDNFPTEVSVLTLGVPELGGEVVVRPQIVLAADFPPGHVPPGQVVFMFRDSSAVPPALLE